MRINPLYVLPPNGPLEFIRDALYLEFNFNVIVGLKENTFMCFSCYLIIFSCLIIDNNNNIVKLSS